MKKSLETIQAELEAHEQDVERVKKVHQTRIDELKASSFALTEAENAELKAENADLERFLTRSSEYSDNLLSQISQ